MLNYLEPPGVALVTSFAGTEIVASKRPLAVVTSHAAHAVW
jgi:hypothetical protein